jgi:hypothetical protein
VEDGGLESISAVIYWQYLKESRKI